MKHYGGDLSASELNHIKELEDLENWFYVHGASISALSAAKGFVCIAHDYTMMHLEEIGEKFLDKADEICPGYFTGPILVHIAKDSDFAMLIGNLVNSLSYDHMNELGFDEEQV